MQRSEGPQRTDEARGASRFALAQAMWQLGRRDRAQALLRAAADACARAGSQYGLERRQIADWIAARH